MMSSMVVELVILVGLQGAGKTTLVSQRFADTHVVVSKDHWPNARRREERQLRLVEDLLVKGKSVVVDNTNPGVAERAPLLEIASRVGVPAHGIYLDVPLEIARKRNARREGKAVVPEVALRVTAKKLTTPTIPEGFSSIETIRSADGPDDRPGHDPATA